MNFPNRERGLPGSRPNVIQARYVMPARRLTCNDIGPPPTAFPSLGPSPMQCTARRRGRTRENSVRDFVPTSQRPRYSAGGLDCVSNRAHVGACIEGFPMVPSDIRRRQLCLRACSDHGGSWPGRPRVPAGCRMVLYRTSTEAYQRSYLLNFAYGSFAYSG